MKAIARNNNFVFSQKIYIVVFFKQELFKVKQRMGNCLAMTTTLLQK